MREYQSFYEIAIGAGAAVILGGRALVPDLRSRLVYAGFGDRMAHFEEFARRFVSPAEASETIGGQALS